MKIIMSKEQNDAMVEVAYFMADLLMDVSDEDYKKNDQRAENHG